jgi:hypothetical protein
MAISPQDYSLWSRMTGNRYPKTAREKAAVGPDVKKFVNNVAKQGAQGGKPEEKKEKVNITGKQIATGALGVGLVAGAVAAARRKGTRDAVTSFLSNLGDKPSTKTYTRPNQGDITPPPVQQQTSTATGMGSLSEKAYSSLQEQQKVTPLSQETPAFAAFKPAENTKPAPGTILGKDLSPAEKQKALAQAKLQEFYAGKYGVDKSGVRSARYEIEKQTSQKEPVVVSQPSAENDEFYTRDELNTMGKIDKLVESIKTGNRPQQPRAVATDVKNTALLQSADNKTPKVNKIIGEPTLKSKLDTKMAVHEETRVANTINEYKGEFDNTYGKVLNQITQGNVSGANDRDKRRAERLTNKVLNKNNPGLVRRFHGAVKQDADIKTRLSAEDASFAATRIYDTVQDSGKAATSVDMGEKGPVLERDMKEMKDVRNINSDTTKGTMKTASGGSIRGRAPSYQEQGFQTKERQDPLGKPGEMIPDRPSRERAQPNVTPFDEEQQTGVSQGKKGGSPGIGIYGEQTGYLPGPFSPTAENKPTDVPFKNVGLTAREQRGLGNVSSEQLRSRIQTDRSGQLRRTARDARVELLSRGATIPTVPPSRDERESRLTFFLPGGTGEAKSTVPQKTAPSTRLESGQRGPASSLQDRPPIGGSDPAVKKRIGADFTQIVDKGIQNINRTVAPDKRQAAIQDLIGKTKGKIKTREAGGLIVEDIQNL